MHIVIIGNGISGITAARTIRKNADHAITVISDESDHFYSRTALMYIFMGHMKYEHTKPYEDFFWSKNRINLLRARVEKVDHSSKTLTLANIPDTLTYDKLIIATGSKPAFYNWPGQELKGVQGLYGLADLEQLQGRYKEAKNAVIVGGGLIGIEMAEMLHSKGVHVSMLVREELYWSSVLPKDEATLVTTHIREHGIDLQLETELQEIIGNQNGEVAAVITSKEERLDCEIVGITTGVKPNVDFLKNTDLEIDKGVLVNEYFETNLTDVYAIGDCVQHRNPPEGRKPLEQIWYTGRMMGERLGLNLTTTKEPYNPGIFFNSAKFFDLEYQVYGAISSKADKHIGEFIFKDYTDIKNRRIINIQFDSETKAVLGINTINVRLRQLVCEKWIKEGYTLENVLSEWVLANFDPEFYSRYETALLAQYEREFGKKIQMVKKKKGLLAKWL